MGKKSIFCVYLNLLVTINDNGIIWIARRSICPIQSKEEKHENFIMGQEFLKG